MPALITFIAITARALSLSFALSLPPSHLPLPLSSTCLCLLLSPFPHFLLISLLPPVFLPLPCHSRVLFFLFPVVYFFLFTSLSIASSSSFLSFHPSYTSLFLLLLPHFSPPFYLFPSFFPISVLIFIFS